MNASQKLNTAELETQIKDMYRNVAQNPQGDYHFEMGRDLALKLGYLEEEINRVPEQAIESFAGVGYFFDLANLQPGEKVLDLGSGSGMDSFVAATKVGTEGSVTGIDMTKEQLEKAIRLSKDYNFKNVEFINGNIMELPFPDKYFDVVISNGVLNLIPDKKRVFLEVSRVLKPEGRLAIADIVSEKELPENIVCNSTLWAACIGGAEQVDSYKGSIENSGLKITTSRENRAYEFLSISALGASKQYGVKSISLTAHKL